MKINGTTRRFDRVKGSTYKTRKRLLNTLKPGLKAIEVNKRKGIYPTRKDALFLARWGEVVRYYDRCWFCGNRLQQGKHSGDTRTVDHLLPLSRGGSNTPANVVYCCLGCNREKGCLNLTEFRQRFSSNHLFFGEREIERDENTNY